MHEMGSIVSKFKNLSEALLAQKRGTFSINHRNINFPDGVWNITMSWNGGEFLCKVCQMMKQFSMYISSAMMMVSQPTSFCDVTYSDFFLTISIFC